jgi:hypothetical protein
MEVVASAQPNLPLRIGCRELVPYKLINGFFANLSVLLNALMAQDYPRGCQRKNTAE